MKAVAKKDKTEKTLSYLGFFIFAVAALPGTFLGGLWASLGIGGGLLAWGLASFGAGRFLKPQKEPAVFAFSFLMLAALLNFQTAYSAVGWHKTLQMATIFLPLLAFTVPEVREKLSAPQLMKMWPWMMGAAALALSIEQSLKGPLLHAVRGPEGILEGYNRGFSYAMMMAWPVAALVWQKRRWGVLLFALSLFPALLTTTSRATIMATVIALAVFGFSYFLPRFSLWVLRIKVVLFGFWAFGARMLFELCPESVMNLPGSWRARVEIWDALSYRIQENPLWGWGLGSAHQLSVASPHSGFYMYNFGPAAHAHNLFTQFWAELGVFGLILSVFFVLWTLERAFRQPPHLRPFAMAAWSGCLVLSLCAYNVWADSLWAMFALLSVAFAWVGQNKLSEN